MCAFLIGNQHFAHCSFRWSTHRRGGLSMCRRAWPGNDVFHCRKATCATNWRPPRKLAKPTDRSERHCATVAHRKCCFPSWKRVVLNIGAPRPGTPESVPPLAEKGASLHSGTGCAKAVFSEMSVFQLESDNYLPPATSFLQRYMALAWAAKGVTCKKCSFPVRKVAISNNGSLR